MRFFGTILTFLFIAAGFFMGTGCSVKEIRDECYSDPRLRAGQSELVLYIRDGSVLVPLSTLNPSDIRFDVSDTTLFRVERAGDSLLRFTPLRPGGPGTVTLSQDEFIPDDGDDWWRHSSASVRVIVVDTVETDLSVGPAPGVLDEGESKVIGVSTNSGAPFHFESRNPLVVQVSRDSVLTGMIMGRTTVTWIQDEWTDANFVTYLPARDSVTVDVVAVPRLSGPVDVVQGKGDTLGVSDPSHLGWALEPEAALDGLTFSSFTDHETRSVRVSAERDAQTGSTLLRLRRLDKGTVCDSVRLTVYEREMERPRFAEEFKRYYVKKGEPVTISVSPCILDPDNQGWVLSTPDGLPADVSSGTGDAPVSFSVPAEADYENPYLILLYSADGQTLCSQMLIALHAQPWLSENENVTLAAGESIEFDVLDPSRAGWGVDCWVDGYSWNEGRFIPDGVKLYTWNIDAGGWIRETGVPSNRYAGNARLKLETTPGMQPCGFTLIIYEEGDGRSNGWEKARVHIQVK